MGATEEQMKLLSEGGVTHVSYVLILYSFAFLLFLCKSKHPQCLPANANLRQSSICSFTYTLQIRSLLQ